MPKMFASLFAGFRLADIGALSAGCELGWDVELDPAIAEVGSQLGGKTIVSSVLDCDPFKFEKPDILWASPPCPNFSIAKANRAETDLDRALAQKIVDFLKVLQPQTFILENVEAYKRSNSLEFIEGALYSLGYWVDRQIVNFADFGVPQTRKRLILRAVKGGFVPSLPPKQVWKGWYGAIEDIIDTLPETQLAEWQLKRLPDHLTNFMMRGANSQQQWGKGYREPQEPMYSMTTDAIAAKAVLIESKNVNQQYGDGLRFDNEPTTTVITDGKPSHQPRAILLDVGNTIRDCTTRSHNEPSITITAEKMRRPASTPKAFLVDGIANSNGQTVTIDDRDCPSYTVKASAGKQASRAWLEQGRVVQMTSRALARFQTLPDWYQLPEKNALACRGIGNGVPCLGAEAIVRSLQEVA